MPDSADDRQWRRNPELAVVERPGRVVVLDLSRHSASPWVLEGSAEAVWRALAQPCSTAKVVDHVALDFGIPATEVEADVTSFLEQLQAAGLVQTGFRPPP